MIALSVAKGMGPAVITSGWLLPAKLDELAASGLKTVYVSIDAACMADHEGNRGLKGLGKRIRAATLRMPNLGMTPLAQIAISKLIHDYRSLVPFILRHLRGEPERFVCYGGYKSFYMDWNFDVWRCDAWRERMGSVWEFAQTPLVRDGCTACIADCYRDSSVMLHFVVSLGDALDRLAEGRMIAALKKILDGRNLSSIGAVIGNAPVLSRLAKLGWPRFSAR